jgi:predicted permease
MGWLNRLAAHFREDRLHRDIEDEIESHLDLRIREHIAEGMPCEEARRAALLSFGNRTAHAERARDAEIIRWLDSAWQNLRYAARVLRKSPVSTAAAVLSIAIGIGANTAIFSLLNAVMFKWLPVKDPQQLVSMHDSPLKNGRHDTAYDATLSYDDYREMRDGAQRYIELYAGMGGAPVMTVGDSVVAARVYGVTGNYYSVLGAHPFLGRFISSDDDREANARLVAVLTYHTWMRQFGGDPTIVGKSILLNGLPFQVIGVEPSRFSDTTLSASLDAVVPFLAIPRLQPKDHSFFAVPAGRLREGVSILQAQDALTSIYQRAKPDHLIRLTPSEPGVPYLRDRYQKPLLVLMAAVSLVLLIACTNVANLLLARGAARRREMSVRLAIGAGRARIVSQLLTESLLIAACGGLLGIALAYAGDAALLAILRGRTSALPLDILPDGRVLAFTVGVAVLTGLLFGLFPAFQAVNTDVSPSLKEGFHPAGARQRQFVRRALVVVQVALSLILLAGAGLFARSLINLRTMDTGYERRGVLLATVDLIDTGYSQWRSSQFYDELLTRVRAIPGVESAAAASDAVLEGGSIDVPLMIDGARCEASTTIASAGYIETMRIGLLAGRTFTERDTGPSSAPVVMINRALARACFPGQNPVGRRVRRIDKKDTDSEIIGVVGNAKYRELRESDRPMFYIPPMYTPGGFFAGLDLHIRTSIDPQFLIAPVRRELHAMDSRIPLSNIRTLEEQSERSLVRDRLLATLSEAFGLIALALAVVGIYGVLAFLVTRRTAEIGVRMALGARRGDVARLVLKESLLLVLTGAALGAWGAHVSRRLFQSLLFGVGASDERATLAAAAVLLIAALLASFLPARRAARIDPMAALRQE